MRKTFISVVWILALVVPLFLQSPGQQTQKFQFRDQGTEVVYEFARPGEVAFVCTGTSQTRLIGLDILNRGGSAADAAIASALARITLDIGQIVSFAGIWMMVYYEASTGKVYSLNACFKTVLEENDPLSISSYLIPNARAVLVPGFMAGVRETHGRFGLLPWANLFEPAISLAENGFPISALKLEEIQDNWNILGILPETRNIFLKRKYGLFRNYEPGDTFTQPELAHTLRQVASLGAGYMYTGDWGRKFVDIVRREGGRMTLQDMEAYEAVWADPAQTTFNGCDIYALGFPSLGAMSVVLGINLMECSNLAFLPHYQDSVEALFRLIYCSRVGEFFYPPYAPEILRKYIPEGDFSYASRNKKENAHLIWERIESGEWSTIERHIASEGYSRPAHSEAIIAMDAYGNVAAVCHTINADNWGNSGIFVDGVSIPGAAYYQQALIDKLGPGRHLPDTTNPCLVLQNGLPIIASSSIGSDLHSATVQNLYNMLLFGMDMQESRRTPKFQSVAWDAGLNQKIRRNTFSQAVIDALKARGLGITLVDHWASEYWIGLKIDH
jgi:gamma-glutamyltranspeptidase/glutathione hydrolase